MVLCFNLLIVWVWPRISGFEVWHATCWVLKTGETRVFRNSVDAFYCVLTKEDLCNLCMQQVLPYLETSIPKCSLVCRFFFFFCGGTKTWKWFSRQEKRWKSAEDPKQKSKTGYYPPKRELGQLRSHLFLYCTWFGNKFHFLHFLVDGQKSCTNFW